MIKWNQKGVSKFQILEILTAILIIKNAMTDNNIGNCNINYLSSTLITFWLLQITLQKMVIKTVIECKKTHN